MGSFLKKDYKSHSDMGKSEKPQTYPGNNFHIDNRVTHTVDSQAQPTFHFQCPEDIPTIQKSEL